MDKNALYKAKFGNNIPNRYKNNQEWIDAKLGITAVVETPEIPPTVEPTVDDIEIEIKDPAPVVKKVNTAPVEKKAQTVAQVVNDVASSNRESYEGIQAFHGFSNNEAFMGQLDKYKLNDREKDLVERFVNNKTQGTHLNNLNYGLFKDWVKPIIERHGLSGEDILAEDKLVDKIYTSYLAMEKAKGKEGKDITPAIQADMIAKSKEEAAKIVSHNTMLKNDLKRKDKQW